MITLQICHNPTTHEHTIYRRTQYRRGSITTTYPTYLAMITGLVREFKDTEHELKIEGAIPNKTDWGNFDTRRVQPLPDIQVRVLCTFLESML